MLFKTSHHRQTSGLAELFLNGPPDPHRQDAEVRLYPAVLVSPFYSNYRNYLGHVFIFLLPGSLPTKQTPRKHVFACLLPDETEA